MKNSRAAQSIPGIWLHPSPTEGLGHTLLPLYPPKEGKARVTSTVTPNLSSLASQRSVEMIKPGIGTKGREGAADKAWHREGTSKPLRVRAEGSPGCSPDKAEEWAQGRCLTRCQGMWSLQ